MAYTPLINLAKEETRKGELPEYEGEVDLSQYDTVFIGGPVWWGTYPQVMFTFFKKHADDLKGKTVIPFTTHEGSGLANCEEDVKAAFPGANVAKGFSIYGHEVRSNKAKVEKWLRGRCGRCNALIQQTGIEPVLAEFGTKMMAWGPLGGQGVYGIVKSEVLAGIGEKYGKSAAQVALRWLTQRGIVAIPKSTHKERMRQNLDIFEVRNQEGSNHAKKFTLTADEIGQIATMNQNDTGTIDFGDPNFVKYLIENYG